MCQAIETRQRCDGSLHSKWYIAGMPPELSWATTTITDHVADVLLRAQGKASRMGPPFWAEMPALFAALDADDSVRAIVLRGEGEAFSHGLDLKTMVNQDDSLAGHLGCKIIEHDS